MKKCPTCHLTYDDSEMFCQTDGMSLVSFGSTEETVVVRTPHFNQQTFQQHSPASANSRQNSFYYLILSAIFLLSLSVVGLGVAYFYEKTKNITTKKEEETNTNKVANVAFNIDDAKTKELQAKVDQLDQH